MFKRARYQNGTLALEERKTGPAVWVFRWRETDARGKRIRPKLQIGDVKRFPTQSKALTELNAIRMDGQKMANALLSVAWKHYSEEELKRKALSTQDSYLEYWKNWVGPKWGKLRLGEIKTVEVERWLDGLENELANGSRAKIKTVMSALFSHCVRWEFCKHNPISSGFQVGGGGRRGPSVGVRVSAKRVKAPLLLTAEQVKLGLAKLDFRDQLLVFLDGALGTRRGELGALRWKDCDFEREEFHIENSYYWRRGGHLKSTKTEASAKPLPMHPILKEALLEWRAESRRREPDDFVSAKRFHKGRSEFPRWSDKGKVSDERMAGTTRLELATSAVTGQRSNQLNYVPSFWEIQIQTRL